MREEDIILIIIVIIVLVIIIVIYTSSTKIQTSNFDITKIPIYIINLKSDEIRRKKITQRLDKFNLKYKIWEAVTPKSEKFKDYKYFDFMSPNEKACAASHYSLWERLITLEDEHFLILEDDIMFKKDWLDYLKEVPKDFDALFLNVSEEVFPNKQWTVINGYCMAGAYIVSKKGLKYLLNKNKDTKDVADYMTLDLQSSNNNSYSYFPWLCIQEHLNSNIQDMNHINKDRLRAVKILANHQLSYDDYI